MILFRCDATPQIGLGHLMRCRALAAALRANGMECMMVGPDNSFQEVGDANLFKFWLELPWSSHSFNDAINIIDIAATYGASGVVLDYMSVDEDYQQVMLESGLHWLQFDGARGQRVWADLIVNASLAAKSSYYHHHAMKANARLLLGPEHAVIRPDFQEISKTQSKIQGHRVLLMCGGGDDRGAISVVINALHPALPKDVVFEIIAGRQNPNHDAHKALIATLPVGRARYHIAPPMLPALMLDSAVAVLAGGTTTYEANLFGIPMVLITIADNQIDQARAWEARGQAIYVGEINSIDSQRIAQATMTQLGQKGMISRLVDGQGAARVAAALTSYLSDKESRHGQVTI